MQGTRGRARGSSRQLEAPEAAVRAAVLGQVSRLTVRVSKSGRRNLECRLWSSMG